MSFTKFAALTLLLAFAEARFGQEQIPVAAVQQLGADGLGSPGVAATIAGSIPGALLAAASPCKKLQIADQMIQELGNDPKVIDAAKALVAAETNFNPFAVKVPFVCSDASLPATAELRGIIPLVDPSVDGAAAENAKSATSLKTPFNADGLSQADVMKAQGFTSFTEKDADNKVGASGGGAAAGGAAAGGADNANTGNANAGNNTGNNANTGSNNNASAGNTGNANAGANNGAGCNANAGNNNNNNNNANAGNNNNNANTGNNNASAGNTGSTAGVDFGVCKPTMARIGGLNGRPATEFTFIPQDPLVAKGQQEALNPNIITNRICDQLTNVCNANAAAKKLCLDAKAQIQALGTRDQSTADTWNALLGFAGADSSAKQA